MPLAQPTPAAMANPVLRYFLATRPPFLSVTLFAALIGIANAHYHGRGISMLSAAVTVVFASVTHGP